MAWNHHCLASTTFSQRFLLWNYDIPSNSTSVLNNQNMIIKSYWCQKTMVLHRIWRYMFHILDYKIEMTWVAFRTLMHIYVWCVLKWYVPWTLFPFRASVHLFVLSTICVSISRNPSINARSEVHYLYMVSTVFISASSRENLSWGSRLKMACSAPEAGSSLESSGKWTI